ncbi:MAG: hypothetical protein IJ087_10815 [Eggerthellaceae bacterium]|nr:hypothetical protein [Eggerthellaceae bacterium]
MLAVGSGVILVLLAELVASALVAAQFPNVFPKSLPSVVDCAEPIVLVQGAFTRVSRIEGEERGTVPVTVMVVREASADAETVANACEQQIRHYGWERNAQVWPWRICGLDTTAPEFEERDSSGRFVWQFEVTLTVARSV